MRNNVGGQTSGCMSPGIMLMAIVVLMVGFILSGCATTPAGWKTTDANHVLSVSEKTEKLIKARTDGDGREFQMLNSTGGVAASAYLQPGNQAASKERKALSAIKAANTFSRANFQDVLGKRSLADYLGWRFGFDSFSKSELLIGFVKASVEKALLPAGPDTSPSP